MRQAAFLLTFLLALSFNAGEVRADIFDAPCQRFNVPKSLLIAIARTESSLQPWVVNVAGKDYHPGTKEQALAIIRAAQARGLSHDVGIMQINNWWLKKLRISPETALEPQNNVVLGAWILAQEIQCHGYNWKAVGAYHSPNPERQRIYVHAVAKRYRKAPAPVTEVSR